jgi:hypothetical protein
MALYADRVKQSLGITGTGTITLTLATTGNGYQSFLSAFGTGTQTVAYCIADQSGPNWEVGTGSYNGSANTLARTTVLASSNGGSLTNFSGGTQDVFCTAPAKYLDTFTSTNQGTVPASGGGTANFLRADGTFAAPPATAPAGSTTQIQYNNAGAFGASANFTYTSGTNTLTTGNITGSALDMTIQPKTPTGSDIAGVLSIKTKDAVVTNESGGQFNIDTGGGNGTGFGGDFVVNMGSSGSAGAGGSFICNTGFAGADGYANFIMGGGGFGVGGNFSMGCGSSSTGSGGDYLMAMAGGPIDNGNMYFQDGYGRNFIWCKTSTGGSGGAQQIGFFNTTPKAQAAAYTKTYSTASRVIPVATFTNLVTTAATNVTPYGFTTQAQADAIATKVNALAADVLILKQLIVSLVNDSSKTLGVGLNNT